jgi:ribonuclease Z
VLLSSWIFKLEILSFKITILGSSGAVPAYGRMPSAQLIDVQNHYFLFDCGEGAQTQLTRYTPYLHRIDHIFISHLHGDHYLGLMGLLFTLHLNRRATDLHLYSHAGLDEIIITQLKYSKSALNFKIIFHRLAPGVSEVIFEDHQIIVSTIPLTHKIPCSGFLIQEKTKPRRINKAAFPDDFPFWKIPQLRAGEDIRDEHGNLLYKNADLTYPPRRSRSYAYCTDTQYSEEIIPYISGVDILYHEATFMNEDYEKALETKHSTAAEAARMALKAKATKLLLGHFSARYKELNGLLTEAKEIFTNTYLANEGDTFIIDE